MPCSRKLRKEWNDRKKDGVVCVVKKIDEQKRHVELVEELSKQLEPVLRNSDQPVCIYLDDRHKRCNNRFAIMLGYPNADIWNDLDVSFLETFVDKDSQSLVMTNYRKTVEKLVGSVVEAKWRRKDGRAIRSKVIHVPITFKGYYFAILFVLEYELV